MRKKVAIIGAGPAGLACAYSLKNNPNFQIEIFEKNSSVGGMAGSFLLWGRSVDYGPHRFFTKYPEVSELWEKVLGNQKVLINRKTRIYYNNKFFNYPLTAFNALANLGLRESIQVILSYFLIKIFPPKHLNTFENWVEFHFGKKLYNIFFKDYTQKLWGISGAELDVKFAIQRIKKFSLGEALKSAFNFSRNNHRSITNVFTYHRNGNGSFYEQIKNDLMVDGAKFHFNCDIEDLIIDSNNCRIKDRGNWHNFDLIVSTMPITLLYKHLVKLPVTELNNSNLKLHYRNTILVYVEINVKKLFDDQWIYINDKQLKTGRVTNFSNWKIELNSEFSSTILCLEYWCNNTDILWNAEDQSIFNIAKSDLELWPVTKGHKILNFHVLKLDKSYPVYGPGYEEDLEKLIKCIDSYKNVFSIGRAGSFKYNNQDHSLLMGIKTAQKICGQKHLSLWSINSDDEYGEETYINSKVA